MSFKAIVFDGYGTLFEDAFDLLKETCGRVVSQNGLAMDQDEFLEAWDRHFFPLIRGPFITLREADLLSLEQVFRELKIQDDPDAYVDQLFERFNSAPVYPDVKPALAGLENGCRTGIVSNADVENMEGVLKENGLGFQVVVTSEAARCYKPDSKIFQRALKSLGCAAGEALYVGDAQEDDIVGAKGVGMQVAWLNRRGERLRNGIPGPDYEIDDLGELLRIL